MPAVWGVPACRGIGGTLPGVSPRGGTGHRGRRGRAAARFAPPSLGTLSRLFPSLEIHELLGAGGMGAVYKARQPALDRWVALKGLGGTGGVASPERFNREARALARLAHPSIVAVHEFGQVEGWHYFIMEYVDGVNLCESGCTEGYLPARCSRSFPRSATPCSTPTTRAWCIATSNRRTCWSIARAG